MTDDPFVHVHKLLLISGHSLIVPPHLPYSNLGGSPLIMHKLVSRHHLTGIWLCRIGCTVEITGKLVGIVLRFMDSGDSSLTIHRALRKQFLVWRMFPLMSPRSLLNLHKVWCCVCEDRNWFSPVWSNWQYLQLRSEVDTVLLWTNVNKAPQPATTAFNSQPPVMPSVSVAPPPGIPAHMQQVPFGLHIAPSTSSASANVTSFNPSSPLRPSLLGGGIQPASGMNSTPSPSAHSSPHAPTAQP